MRIVTIIFLISVAAYTLRFHIVKITYPILGIGVYILQFIIIGLWLMLDNVPNEYPVLFMLYITINLPILIPLYFIINWHITLGIFLLGMMVVGAILRLDRGS